MNPVASHSEASSRAPRRKIDQRLRSAARGMRGEWKGGGKGAWLVTHGAVRCIDCVRRRWREHIAVIDAATQHIAMNYDKDKVDEGALALLYLTLHDGCRAWKGLDWDVMDRLHEKGMIRDPKGKAKSVVLTE